MRITTAIILGAFLLSISACMKDHSDHILNINYPAAYVVNGASNNISVIRLSDNTVTETISLNGATFPHHIYMNPAKTKLAVAITGVDLSAGYSEHPNSVSGYKIQIIDAVTGMIDKEILLSKMAHNAVFSPDGNELWVGQSDTIESKVLVFRVSDWICTDTVLVNEYVAEVTFSANASYVMATCSGANLVNMIYPDSKVVECATLTGGDRPIGTWKGDTAYSYTNNEASQSLSEIDVENDVTNAIISLGFTPAYVAYRTMPNELWVSDATNGRVVIFARNAGTWTESHAVATGANAHAVVFNADESIAYVTNQNTGTVSVINTDTYTKIRDISVGQKPNGIVIKQ